MKVWGPDLRTKSDGPKSKSVKPGSQPRPFTDRLRLLLHLGITQILVSISYIELRDSDGHQLSANTAAHSA